MKLNEFKPGNLAILKIKGQEYPVLFYYAEETLSCASLDGLLEIYDIRGDDICHGYICHGYIHNSNKEKIDDFNFEDIEIQKVFQPGEMITLVQ